MWRFSSEDGTGKVFYDGPYGEDDAGWFDGIKLIRVEIFLQLVRVEFLSSLRKEKACYNSAS